MRENLKTRFEREGYLVVEDLLGQSELTACRVEIDRLHHLAAQLEAAEDPRSQEFQREPYARVAKRDDGLPLLRKIEQTGEFSEVFRNLAAHRRLIEILQELIGPDLLQYRSTLMLKPAFHGSAHKLHQDSAYWPIDPPTLVTVSIALSEATPANGCFRVIPRSHQWGLQDWGRIARSQEEGLTDRADIDRSDEIEVPLAAGSALFFHSLLVHGSGPNRSPISRNTALYAYFSPHVRYIPKSGLPKKRTFRVITGLSGAEECTLTAERTDTI